MTLKLNGDGAIAATKITPILNWPPFELGAAPTLRTDCSWCRRSTEESVQGLLVFAVFLRAWDQASTPAERDLQDLVHVHHVHNATNSIHLVWSLGKICARPQQSCDARMNVVTLPPPSTNQVKSDEIWDRFQKTYGFKGDLCPTQTLLNWTSGFKGPWSLMSHMEEGSCVYLRTEPSNQSQKGKPVFGREEHPTANTPFEKRKRNWRHGGVVRFADYLCLVFKCVYFRRSDQNISNKSKLSHVCQFSVNLCTSWIRVFLFVVVKKIRYFPLTTLPEHTRTASIGELVRTASGDVLKFENGLGKHYRNLGLTCKWKPVWHVLPTWSRGCCNSTPQRHMCFAWSSGLFVHQVAEEALLPPLTGTRTWSQENMCSHSAKEERKTKNQNNEDTHNRPSDFVHNRPLETLDVVRSYSNTTPLPPTPILYPPRIWSQKKQGEVQYGGGATWRAKRFFGK